jgi:hypothetical protein
VHTDRSANPVQLTQLHKGRENFVSIVLRGNDRWGAEQFEILK